MYDGCKEIVRDIVERIDKSEFRSETDVRRGIVDPILQELGWPVSRPRVVEREYAVEGGRVDYALCDQGKPLVFVEAKRPGGVTDAGRKQLFGYCAAHGVPMAVLTDGQEWNFFLPLRPGPPDERRLPGIALSSDATEACRALHRYLDRRVVTSGENIEGATHDLERMQLESVCETVWRELIQRPHDDILGMFLKAVKEETTINPDRDVVIAWIRGRASGTGPPPPPPPPGPPPEPPADDHWVEFRGKRTPARNGKEVLVKAFSLLAEEDPAFLHRYAPRGLGRRISRDRTRIRRAPEGLPGGWWIETSISNAEKSRWIREACDVARVAYGRELIANFPRPIPRNRRDGR